MFSPYNENGTGVLCVQFVHKSFELLHKVYSSDWRKPVGERACAGDIWNVFRTKNVIFLKISDVKIKYFPHVDLWFKKVMQRPTHVVRI